MKLAAAFVHPNRCFAFAEKRLDPQRSAGRLISTLVVTYRGHGYAVRYRAHHLPSLQNALMALGADPTNPLRWRGMLDGLFARVVAAWSEATEANCKP